MEDIIIIDFKALIQMLSEASNGKMRMFDDTNDPGKVRIAGLAVDSERPTRVLYAHDLPTTAEDYMMLTWGKAFGFEHPALVEYDEQGRMIDGEIEQNNQTE